MENLEQSSEDVVTTIRYLSKYSSLFHLYVVWLRRLCSGAVLLIVLLVGVQLAYPAGRARPLLHVKGIAVGSADKNGITARLQKLRDQKVAFKLADGKTVNYAIGRLGIQVDPKSADRVLHYSLQERLTPFSLFRRQFTGSVALSISEPGLSSFTGEFTRDHDTVPTDAKIIEGSQGYVMQEHHVGVEYEAQAIKKSIQSAALLSDPVIVLPSKLVEPNITNEDAASAYSVLNSATANDFTVIVEGKAYAVKPATVKAWVHPVEESQQGKIDVQYDRDAIKAWLRGIADGYYVAATAGTQTIQDGQVVSTVVGQAGKRLNIDKLATTITDALSKQQHSTDAALETFTAANKVARSYTQSNAGLSALINDWVKAHGGGTYGVTVRELGGQGRSASYNADQFFFSASIYKLWVVDYLMHRVEAGNLNPASTLGSNRSVDACIDATILVSDNACPEGVANAVGWGTLDSFAKTVTPSGVGLAGGGIRVTANGSADFMTRLYDGQLLSQANTSRMLDLMKRQKYRSAIPAGSRGAVVADKVGFYGDVWHDVAIVYGAKTTYILSILTKNGSYAQIADLAGQIYDNLN